jgi:hypothetical protein
MCTPASLSGCGKAFNLHVGVNPGRRWLLALHSYVDVRYVSSFQQLIWGL